VSLLDDRSLACATRPGRLYLLGVADRSQIADPLDIAHAPTAFVRSPRSDYIACGTSTGDVYVVSREHWGVHLPKKCGARITDLTFSPDPESRLIAAAAASGVVHVWDYISGLSVPLNRGAVAGETFLRFSSDGTRLLVAHADGVIIEMWELIWGGLSGAA
jgi:WD40 repeat protein